MDYEIECKRCGKCCTPGFPFEGEFVRLKSLRCAFLTEENLCSIYAERKNTVGCLSPWEMPDDWLPAGCAFGGVIREISGKEEEAFLIKPSWELITILKSGLFMWR